MTILQILNQLDATRSKKEKVAILEQNVNNADLREFFRLALTGSLNFFQKKKIEYVPSGNNLFSLASAMSILKDEIATRAVTGHAARDLCASIMAGLIPDDAEVFQRILQKDPKCGVSSSVNDVWPNLIPEHPNLLASPYSQKLAEALNWKKGVIIERKSDGLRVSVEIDDGSVTVYSRAGNTLDLMGRFDSLGAIPTMFGRVLDGELMVVKSDGTFEDRKTGNGIASKAIKGTLSVEEANKMVVVVWDVIPTETFWKKEKTKLGAAERFNQLKYCLGALEGETEKLLRSIEHEVVHSIDEAQKIHEAYREAGEEGSMWKDPDVQWEDRRSKKILKVS
jgi:hypothetical protein